MGLNAKMDKFALAQSTDSSSVLAGRNVESDRSV